MNERKIRKKTKKLLVTVVVLLAVLFIEILIANAKEIFPILIAFFKNPRPFPVLVFIITGLSFGIYIGKIIFKNDKNERTK